MSQPRGLVLTHHYHADTIETPSCKLLIYLTDITEESITKPRTARITAIACLLRSPVRAVNEGGSAIVSTPQFRRQIVLPCVISPLRWTDRCAKTYAETIKIGRLDYAFDDA
jgi:hypothetical protein